MSGLPELGLTPAQAAEVQGLSEELVAAWLAETSARPGLERPAGFFLHGVRSGNMPAVLVAGSERKALALAERRVHNLGHAIETPSELLAELFAERGVLERYDSPAARERMLAQWRALRVRPVPWP